MSPSPLHQLAAALWLLPPVPAQAVTCCDAQGWGWEEGAGGPGSCRKRAGRLSRWARVPPGSLQGQLTTKLRGSGAAHRHQAHLCCIQYRKEVLGCSPSMRGCHYSCHAATCARCLWACGPMLATVATTKVWPYPGAHQLRQLATMTWALLGSPCLSLATLEQPCNPVVIPRADLSWCKHSPVLLERAHVCTHTHTCPHACAHTHL